jgi:hypothetical protein
MGEYIQQGPVPYEAGDKVLKAGQQWVCLGAIPRSERPEDRHLWCSPSTKSSPHRPGRCP